MPNETDAETTTDADDQRPTVCEIHIEDAAFVAAVPRDGNPAERVTDAVVRPGDINPTVWVQHLDDDFEMGVADDTTQLLCVVTNVSGTVWVQNVPDSLEMDDNRRLSRYGERALTQCEAVHAIVRVPVREATIVEQYDSTPNGADAGGPGGNGTGTN